MTAEEMSELVHNGSIVSRFFKMTVNHQVVAGFYQMFAVPQRDFIIRRHLSYGSSAAGTERISSLQNNSVGTQVVY